MLRRLNPDTPLTFHGSLRDAYLIVGDTEQQRANLCAWFRVESTDRRVEAWRVGGDETIIMFADQS